MRRLENGESDNVNNREQNQRDREEDEEEKQKVVKILKSLAPNSEDVGIQERHSTGADPEDELKFGEQLQDDLINSFCDKLQAACPRRLEAFMAIQFLMITDIEDIRKHVTGKCAAMQVLYDRTRSHYVLVHYNPRWQKVEIYDSLQPWNKSGEPEILTELSTHISHLFGHLFTKYIACIVDREYETQTDNFSCGYRVIGALVDLARQRNPCTQTYSRTAILNFMRKILAEPHPTWQMFESARFGCNKNYSGEHRASIYLLNSTYTSSTSSSSLASSTSRSSYKRTSSVDSLASFKSDRSNGSQGDTGGKARKAMRRAHAGHQEENPFQENPFQENPFRQMEYMPPQPVYRAPYIPIAWRPTPYFGHPGYQVNTHPYAPPPPPPPAPNGDQNKYVGYFLNTYQSVANTVFPRKANLDVEQGKQ